MALFGNKKEEKEAKKPAAKKAKAAPKKDAVKMTAPVSMQDLYSHPAAAKVTKTVGAKNAGIGRHEASYRILIKPLVTEKASNLAAENKYVFVVAKTANKISVAKAIFSTFGIKPTAVNMISSDGKFVARGKVRGQRKDWKKAIVTLPKGETIKVYEGV